MLQLRRSQDRGIGKHGGWLNSRHSFSFADYVDPQRMGFSALRVINDDEVAPGAGFPQHAHRDMEIISMVLQGSIEHKDSMGHVTQLHAGEVQRMSAGSGITHSEYNPSADEILRFLQIWIEPNRMGISPSYDQRDVSQLQSGRLNLLASPDGREGSMQLQQDAFIYLGRLSMDGSTDSSTDSSLVNEESPSSTHSLDPARKYYFHLVSGELQVNQQMLFAGDALTIENEDELHVLSETESEFLFFDLP